MNKHQIGSGTVFADDPFDRFRFYQACESFRSALWSYAASPGFIPCSWANSP